MNSFRLTRMPMAVARSFDRVTWPSSRAFLSFCCDAFSVLSPLPDSAIALPFRYLHLLPDHFQHLPRHARVVVRDETHHLAQHQQPEQGDDGKTQRKQIQRGCHAIEETETELYHDGGKHDWNGQQHCCGEDPRGVPRHCL